MLVIWMRNHYEKWRGLMELLLMHSGSTNLTFVLWQIWGHTLLNFNLSTVSPACASAGAIISTQMLLPSIETHQFSSFRVSRVSWKECQLTEAFIVTQTQCIRWWRMGVYPSNSLISGIVSFLQRMRVFGKFLMMYRHQYWFSRWYWTVDKNDLNAFFQFTVQTPQLPSLHRMVSCMDYLFFVDDEYLWQVSFDTNQKVKISLSPSKNEKSRLVIRLNEMSNEKLMILSGTYHVKLFDVSQGTWETLDFLCPYCFKVFHKSNNLLNDHMACHFGPVSCEICEVSIT